MLGRTGADDPAVRRDDVRGEQIVQGAAVLPDHPAEPAAECEPGYAGRPHEATGRRQIEELQLVIEFRPRNAGLDARRAVLRIHMNALHRRKVNDHAPVAQAEPCHIVARRAHRDFDVVPPGKFDGRAYVGNAGAPHNHGRMPVDHRVVNPARSSYAGSWGRMTGPRSELRSACRSVSASIMTPPPSYVTVPVVSVERWQLRDATLGEKINPSLRLDRLDKTISPRERRGMRPPIGRCVLNAAFIRGCGDAAHGALKLLLGGGSRCSWSESIGPIPSMSIV